MEMLFLVAVPAVFAGIVQGSTGFGAGILLMIFLPILHPLVQSAGVSGVIISVLSLLMVVKYRKSINYRKMILPFVIYSVICTGVIAVAKDFDTGVLKTIFGIFLLGLSVYHLLIKKDSGRQTYSVFITILFAAVSGVFSGLFGVGGPLMAIYFLSVSDSKEEYLGTIQFFFLVTVIMATFSRIYNHILTVQCLPDILLGVIGILSGLFISNYLLAKIDIVQLRKVVYLFIGVSGVFYIF